MLSRHYDIVRKEKSLEGEALANDRAVSLCT